MGIEIIKNKPETGEGLDEGRVLNVEYSY